MWAEDRKGERESIVSKCNLKPLQVFLFFSFLQPPSPFTHRKRERERKRKRKEDTTC